MTEAQQESIKFYVGNDYLLINNIMWGNWDKIDSSIKSIVNDAHGVMREALEMGFDKRWGTTLEEGQKIFDVYKKRIPEVINETTKQQMIKQAYNDIENIFSAMKRTKEEFVVYRNASLDYFINCKVGDVMSFKSFSSTSTEKHEIGYHNKKDQVQFVINIPKNFPVLRLDIEENRDISNEKDEVILPPFKFQITKILDADFGQCKKIMEIQPFELIKFNVPKKEIELER